MANNPITVPLPQDLPETWAVNQIVSPDGVSAGLTPQHGYNYLMKQVNNAQQAAQELGEGIAGLSGDNLPASSDGGETISSALSNKADKGPPQVYDLPLAEGVEVYASNVANYYCKNEFGEVSINTNLKIGIPLVSGMIIATIPQGFRRYDVISFPIIGYYSQNNNVFNGHITIEQTGSIRLWVRNIDQENSGASWISNPSAAFIATN